MVKDNKIREIIEGILGASAVAGGGFGLYETPTGLKLNIKEIQNVANGNPTPAISSSSSLNIYQNIHPSNTLTPSYSSIPSFRTFNLHAYFINIFGTGINPFPINNYTLPYLYLNTTIEFYLNGTLIGTANTKNNSYADFTYTTNTEALTTLSFQAKALNQNNKVWMVSNIIEI